MLAPALFFGHFDIFALNAFNKMTNRIDNLINTYSQQKTMEHARCRAELDSMFKDTSSKAPKNIWINNMKRSGDIDNQALISAFRSHQDSGIIDPPAINIGTLFNPDPRIEQRTELANRFNKIRINKFFNKFEAFKDLLLDEGKIEESKTQTEEKRLKTTDVGEAKISFADKEEGILFALDSFIIEYFYNEFYSTGESITLDMTVEKIPFPVNLLKKATAMLLSTVYDGLPILIEQGQNVVTNPDVIIKIINKIDVGQKINQLERIIMDVGIFIANGYQIEGKVNSESESNENSFEIFVVEAAEQADPVVEVNGIRIWIQPLPADIYHLDHDMTLDDFLALIGILNDPSKQAIYTNPITGATFILNNFDGNMPLVDVLDLIGYDRTNLEQQFLGNAHRIQIIDTTTLLQLQDDTKALFHPDVSEEIFYRHGVTDYQRSYFSKKVLDAFNVVKSRIQDTFRKTVYESAYNIIKTKYSEDFGITQEEWLELVDSKAKDEHGAFTQEFEKIVDLCFKEQVFLNLIELSGAQDQDVNEIFSTLDTYLDENFGSLIEQLFAPITFEAFISEVINQFLNNIDNEGFVSFSVPTQEYFEDLISVQDSYKDELVLVYWGSPPPPEFKNDAFIESNYKEELDDLSLLFYRIREYLIDQNNRDLPITDTLLGLHGPDDPGTYTRLYLTNVFKDLGIIDENILQNIHFTQKSFYKTLLEQIQLDIQNNPDLSIFSEYSFLIGMQFSLDEFFDDADQQIVKFIDDIMNKEIGYVGYTLLKLDMIRFDGNGQIKFQMPQDLRTLTKIIRVLGLNSVAEIDTNDIVTLIWSILLSGHYTNLMTIDNNGQVELRKVYTYPGSQFFTGIFNNFMGNIPDSIYHLSIIWNFINSPFITDRFEVFQRIEQTRNPLFYAGMEQKLRDLHIPQQVGNRIIWQEYELIGGTDTFQIEEAIMDQNGFYHSTGDLMDSFYIWLKWGNIKEGLFHTIEDHGKKHFEDEWNLMSDRKKSDFILGTINNQIGYRIRDNLILYQVHINNRIDYLCVAFSQDFHFIITAYQLKPELRQIYVNLFS